MTEEQRKAIFNILREELAKCTPPMVISADVEAREYSLIGNKSVPYGYDKKIIPGMFFASVVHRKDSVAFHFFPMYYADEMKAMMPSLVKCLKGKTCFHFKKTDQVNLLELRALLAAGIQSWQDSGYME